MKYINKEKLNKDIFEKLSKDLKNADIAGAAVMVTQNGETVCDIKCGYKNIETNELLKK